MVVPAGSGHGVSGYERDSLNREVEKLRLQVQNLKSEVDLFIYWPPFDCDTGRSVLGRVLLDHFDRQQQFFGGTC